MKRCVIVGGAEIRTYERVRSYFRPDDFFIYCDCGLRHQAGLEREPDLIIGDFDSHEKPETDRETIVLPVKKDDTDTVYAAKEALRREKRHENGKRIIPTDDPLSVWHEPKYCRHKPGSGARLPARPGSFRLLRRGRITPVIRRTARGSDGSSRTVGPVPDHRPVTAGVQDRHDQYEEYRNGDDQTDHTLNHPVPNSESRWHA